MSERIQHVLADSVFTAGGVASGGLGFLGYINAGLGVLAAAIFAATLWYRMRLARHELKVAEAEVDEE